MKRGQVYDPAKLRVTKCGCSIDMRGRVVTACHWHVGDEREWKEASWPLILVMLLPLVLLILVGFVLTK